LNGKTLIIEGDEMDTKTLAFALVAMGMKWIIKAIERPNDE